MDAPPPSRWDVIVVGGALSGASTACLLLRRNPRLRVLILERSTQHKRRVGESTVEISAYFLGRVLGLTEHLLQNHLPKQGLRYWFANENTRALDQCSETGPRYNVRLPGFQIDRAVLDEHILANAVADGATVLRPVRVRRVVLAEGAEQTVEWEDADATAHTAAARWVVDASGVAALLARQEGWLQANTRHPTAASWGRYTGVRSFDDPGLAAQYPAWFNRVKAQRGMATNHFCGYGWWGWTIPLKGGDISVGFVYDQRLIELPPGPNLSDRLLTILRTHPVAREVLADARCQDDDVSFRRNLAFSSRVFATDGAVLVGDAGSFIDPFYSPGMDGITFSVCAAVALIDDSFRGKPVAPRVARHNANFCRSYECWFRALYLDKYYYLGDFELMTLAFRLDLGLYYIGIVQQPFRHGNRILETPPFAHPKSTWPFRLMALYNRRFAAMARNRRQRGVWGRYNDRRRFDFTSYEFNHRLPVRVLGLLFLWLGLELREGWRSWFSARVAVPAAAPVSSPS